MAGEKKKVSDRKVGFFTMTGDFFFFFFGGGGGDFCSRKVRPAVLSLCFSQLEIPAEAPPSERTKTERLPLRTHFFFALRGETHGRTNTRSKLSFTGSSGHGRASSFQSHGLYPREQQQQPQHGAQARQDAPVSRGPFRQRPGVAEGGRAGARLRGHERMRR